MISHAQETPRKKKMISREPVTVEDKTMKTAQKQGKSIRRERATAVKPTSPTRSLIEGMEVDKIEDEGVDTRIEVPFVKLKKTARKDREEILSKVCVVEVCKPEICCADLEGKLPFSTTAQTSFRRVGKAIYFFAFHASLGTTSSWSDKITRSPLKAR